MGGVDTLLCDPWTATPTLPHQPELMSQAEDSTVQVDIMLVRVTAPSLEDSRGPQGKAGWHFLIERSWVSPDGHPSPRRIPPESGCRGLAGGVQSERRPAPGVPGDHRSPRSLGFR